MPNLRFDYCILCGAPATDGHHIIPRGHIGGKNAEDWPVNRAPMCHACHMRWHSEGPRRALAHVGIEIGGGEYDAVRELWSRMEYTLAERTVLLALGYRQWSSYYPLVRARSDWVKEQREPISGAVYFDAVEGGNWEPLVNLIAGPIPGWIGVE